MTPLRRSRRLASLTPARQESTTPAPSTRKRRETTGRKKRRPNPTDPTPLKPPLPRKVVSPVASHAAAPDSSAKSSVQKTFLGRFRGSPLPSPEPFNLLASPSPPAPTPRKVHNNYNGSHSGLSSASFAIGTLAALATRLEVGTLVTTKATLLPLAEQTRAWVRSKGEETVQYFRSCGDFEINSKEVVLKRALLLTLCIVTSWMLVQSDVLTLAGWILVTPFRILMFLPSALFGWTTAVAPFPSDAIAPHLTPPGPEVRPPPVPAPHADVTPGSSQSNIDLEAYYQRVETLAHDFDELKSGLLRVAAEASRGTEVGVDLKEKLEELDAKIERKHADLQAMLAGLSDTGDADSVNDALLQLTQPIDALRDTVSQQDAAMETLRGDLTEGLAAQRTSLNALSASHADAEARAQKSASQQSSLERDVARHAVALKRVEGSIAGLEEDLGRLAAPSRGADDALLAELVQDKMGAVMAVQEELRAKVEQQQAVGDKTPQDISRAEIMELLLRTKRDLLDELRADVVKQVRSHTPKKEHQPLPRLSASDVLAQEGSTFRDWITKEVAKVMVSPSKFDGSESDIVEAIVKRLASTPQPQPRPSAGVSAEQIEGMLLPFLRKFEADKTGKVDYALYAGGGRIRSASSTYTPPGAQSWVSSVNSWFSKKPHPATAAITPSSSPGDCWSMEGRQGHLVVQLPHAVLVGSVSVEHVDPLIAHDPSSAPREFTVTGYTLEGDEVSLLSNAEYLYRHNTSFTSALQTFPVRVAPPVVAVEFRVHSNHGHPQYTCIYRVRVHPTG